MSKIRLKQIDQSEVSGYILDVTSGNFSSLSGTVSGLTTSGDTLSGEYSNLVSIVNILSGQNTGISGRLSTIESEFDAFDVQVNNFSGQVYSLSGEVVTLSNDLDVFSGDVVAAESGVSSLTTSVNTLSGRLNTLSGNVLTATGTINSNITTLSGRIDTTSGTLVSTNITVAALSGSYTGFTGRYVNDYVLVLHTGASGSGGGAATAFTWTTRAMNCENFDEGNICSVSSNRITLSGGKYICNITANAYLSDRHRARLYSITSGITLLTGSSSVAAAVYNSETPSFIRGIINLPTGQILEIQHILGSAAGGSYSLGVGNSGLSDGLGTSIYAEAEFRRIVAY